MRFNYKDYANTNGLATAREIAQQPDAWLKTAEIIESRLEEIKCFMKAARAHENLLVSFTGAGSSGFCAEMVSAGVNQYLGCRSNAPHTTDIVASPDSALNPDTPTLLISFGRSGNSPESVAAVEYARKKVKTLYEIAITCAEDGKLAAITGNGSGRLTVILPPETCDEGFAMTSSLTSMALAAYGVLACDEFNTFKANVAALSEVIEKRLDGLAGIACKVANGFDFDRIAYLGCGALKGAAHESTVKMCELTTGNVSVVYDTSLGFRHGPKFMIKERTITMHMISGDPLTNKYDIDLLREIIMQKHGNRIITLSAASLGLDGIDYEVIYENSFPNDFFFAVACLVFSQLLAFFTSQKMGVSTDSPSADGALNRVVQGVTIY